MSMNTPAGRSWHYGIFGLFPKCSCRLPYTTHPQSFLKIILYPMIDICLLLPTNRNFICDLRNLTQGQLAHVGLGSTTIASLAANE